MPEKKIMKEHQKLALERMANGKILGGKPGVGKTLVAVNYYLEREAPKDVYVITTARKRDDLDWDAEFIAHGIARSRDDIGDAEALDAGPAPLHVDSWNNIGKYVGVRGAFFILDEQRLVGTGAWVKSFLKIAKNNNWIMLSGTPGDTWMDYVAVFIANGFYKNRTEFKEMHVVYKPYTKYPAIAYYTGVSRLHQLRHHILVPMKYERHTVRHLEHIKVDHDAELMKRVEKDRWHVYEERPLRNNSERYAVMRKVAYSHSSRLETLAGLISEHKRMIVFYNFDYELEELRKLCQTPTPVCTRCSTLSDEMEVTPTSASLVVEPSSKRTSRCSSGTTTKRTTALCDPTEHSDEPRVQLAEWNGHKHRSESVISEGSTPPVPRPTDATIHVAEWNGHKHQPIPTSERWVYLVQYQAGAEAWDCITTNHLVFYSLTYSYKIFEQAQGRIDRLNTPFQDLYYHILRSSTNIDVAVWKALSEKRDFVESEN